MKRLFLPYLREWTGFSRVPRWPRLVHPYSGSGPERLRKIPWNTNVNMKTSVSNLPPSTPETRNPDGVPFTDRQHSFSLRCVSGRHFVTWTFLSCRDLRRGYRSHDQGTEGKKRGSGTFRDQKEVLCTRVSVENPRITEDWDKDRECCLVWTFNLTSTWL